MLACERKINFGVHRRKIKVVVEISFQCLNAWKRAGSTAAALYWSGPSGRWATRKPTFLLRPPEPIMSKANTFPQIPVHAGDPAAKGPLSVEENLDGKIRADLGLGVTTVEEQVGSLA